MPGDYSRNTFDPAKHYTRVRMQEGRVQLDSDYNENSDDLLHRIVAETRDVIGPSGSPRYGGGFRVSITPDAADLTLSAGNMYVDGILVELDGEVVYGKAIAIQPHVILPKLIIDGRGLEIGDWLDIWTQGAQVVAKVTNIDAASGDVTLDGGVVFTDDAAIVRRATTYLTQPDYDPQPLANGKYVAYLAVWEREVSALDDPDIREVALGDPDTARRMQTVWQVWLRALNPAGVNCDGAKTQLDAALEPSTGKLAARTAPVLGETDPCLLPPTAGYLGMENQLYRIEIHRPGTIPAASPNDLPTFKWSRDNASLEVSVETISGRDLTVRKVGRDDLFRFENDQWVEIADDASWRTQTPNPLRQIDIINAAIRTITLKTNPPATVDQHRKLRRWNHNGTADQDGVAITGTGWNTLEYGIQVQFGEGVYHAGDYWQIPARTATHDIEWKRYDDVPEHEPPLGIARHYAPLAIVEVINGQVAVANITDCRKPFPPLTHICADDVCFDPTHCEFPANVRNVQQALDMLCDARDLRFLYKYFFGLGIVCGLQLVCKGGRVVTVKPGYALDCEGHIIHVGPAARDLDLTTLPEWANLQNQDSVCLSIARGANGPEFHLHSASGVTPPQATTGIIEGTVTDSSGSVLPGVTVTIRNTATNVERQQITDATGRYRGVALPPGPYEVTASLAGFAQHVVSVNLAAGQTRTIDIRVSAGAASERVIVTAEPLPDERNSVLDGTPLMDAYEDCFKSVTDYFTEKFKPDSTSSDTVSDGQKRLTAAWNILAQLYNPTKGRKVFISRQEHDLLAQVYNDLRNLLKMSGTYCALGTVPDFPAYPFAPDLPETIWFGKGNHSKVRAFEVFTVTYGGDNFIDVFDNSKGEMIQRLTFPDLGTAIVRDVAMATDGRRLHVTAEFNSKSYVATFDQAAPPANRWTHAVEIKVVHDLASTDRITSLATGTDGAQLYGLGTRSIYKINPTTGNAQSALLAAAPAAFAGHFLVEKGRCLAATRSQASTPAGKYDSLTQFSIRNGDLIGPELFPLGGFGDEGIAYSESGDRNARAMYAALDASGGEKRRLVAITGPDNPFMTELPHQEGRVSLAGLSGQEFAGAAVAFSEAYETRFHFVGQGRFAEFTPAVLPTQICPSAVAIGPRNDVLVLNHAVATIARFDEEVYANPNPVDMPKLKAYRDDVVEKFKHLFVLMAESMKDCFCEHFLINCPECTAKDIVYLGCLELQGRVGFGDGRTVKRICSLEKRIYVLSPRLVRYWLSYIPIIPVVSRVIEAFCCLDLPKIFENRIQLPPDGAPDHWNCPQLGTFTSSRFSQFTQPFQNLWKSNFSKISILRDLFLQPQPTNGWKPVVEPVDVINQPIEIVRRRFADAGIPIAAIEAFDSSAGFKNFARAVTEFLPGQPVTLVERDGRVAFVHDRVTPSQVETLRADVEKAVTTAEEAKQSNVDGSALRSEIADVQRRVAAVEARPDDTLSTIAREILRVRDDIRREVGDDVERLRARIEDARRIVDERDTMIRSLTGTIEKLQDDLKAARTFQTEAQTKFDTLAGKVAGIDELRTLIGRLRPPIG